jgi:hypothetical protein
MLSGVCVLYVLMWHLMGSAGCGAAWLKSQSAKRAARYRIGAVICSLPRASLRSGARFDLLSDWRLLCRIELGAVAQHGVHDDGKAPGERDPRLAIIIVLAIANAQSLSFSAGL